MNKSVDLAIDINSQTGMELHESAQQAEICNYHIGMILPVHTEQSIAKSFQKGLKSVLKDINHPVSEISTELVAQSSASRYTEAIVKLFEFDEVDLIIGLFSTHEISTIAKLAEKYKKPIIACHLGEHLPLYTEKYAYLYVYSLSIWQHVWALGHWAVSTLGQKGLFVTDLYDGGYAFGTFLDLGMNQESEDSRLSFHLTPNTQDNSLDLTAFYNVLERDRPDFVYASFNGAQAGRFLEAYANSPYCDIPLVGLPFLLDNGTPAPENIKAYTSLILSAETVDHIYENWGRRLAEWLRKLSGQQVELNQSIQSLATAFLSTWQLNDLSTDIVILKQNESESLQERSIVYHISPLGADNEKLMNMLTDINSAWINSYMTR
ncbi:ABC transporter substrate-binding protein [Sphingobacterium spiritivorum]|uniref:ABC transporter substrate-binding protein n=1 Tax=Sphingobacterium spiritivorum TaxID=258 RepID=UPI003DA3E89C